MQWFKGGILAGVLILSAAGAGGMSRGIEAQTPVQPTPSPEQPMSMNGGSTGGEMMPMNGESMGGEAMGSMSAQMNGESDVMVSQNSMYGAILTDSQGMTLYTRTTDMADTSTCTGNCLNSWPPLQPSADMMGMMSSQSGGMMMALPGASAMLGVMTRDDGTEQLTYNEWPLYTFARDMAPGDTNGQGVGGFTVAMP